MADSKVTVAQDDEFTVVSEGTTEPETKVVFDTMGESWIGESYLGMRKIESADGNYLQARFQNVDGLYFINANHSLREGLKTVPTGSKVRLTWIDELDTGQAQPMRVFRVEKARRNASRST